VRFVFGDLFQKSQHPRDNSSIHGAKTAVLEAPTALDIFLYGLIMSVYA
jgi:hypothetical protein